MLIACPCLTFNATLSAVAFVQKSCLLGCIACVSSKSVKAQVIIPSLPPFPGAGCARGHAPGIQQRCHGPAVWAPVRSKVRGRRLKARQQGLAARRQRLRTRAGQLLNLCKGLQRVYRVMTLTPFSTGLVARRQRLCTLAIDLLTLVRCFNKGMVGFKKKTREQRLAARDASAYAPSGWSKQLNVNHRPCWKMTAPCQACRRASPADDATLGLKCGR